MDYYGLPEDVTYTYLEPKQFMDPLDNKHEIENVTTTRFFISSKYIRELTHKDFNLREDTYIRLNRENKDCMLIFFYNETLESKRLAHVWANVSRNAPGPVYGCVNLSNELDISKTFNKLNYEPDHPFHWASLKQVPFVLVYRNTWPQAFYNGDFSTQSLINYSLNNACMYNYQEKKQVITKNNNIELKPKENISIPKNNPYLNQKRPTSEFVSLE